MWDEEDGFFYDVLRLPDGTAAAAEGAVDGRAAAALRGHGLRRRAARRSYPELARAAAAVPRGATRAARRHPRPAQAGRRRPPAGRRSSTRPSCAGCWREMLDENEFLSPYGIRSLSRYHADHPYVVPRRRPGVPGRATCRPSPTPACSAATRTGAGRSGCRSTRLIIRALLQYYRYYGDDFTVECPTGSGRQMNLYQVAEEIGRRLAAHLPARRGRAAARSTAATEKFQDDPHWRDLHPVLRVLPRRQRRRPRRQPPDRLDRRHRPRSCTCSPRRRGEEVVERGPGLAAAEF